MAVRRGRRAAVLPHAVGPARLARGFPCRRARRRPPRARGLRFSLRLSGGLRGAADRARRRRWRSGTGWRTGSATAPTTATTPLRSRKRSTPRLAAARSGAGRAARRIPACPRSKSDRRPVGLPDFRRVEAVAAGAKSCWQLAYAGSVGAQALTGIAALARLRRDPRLDGAVVWPFETGLAAPDAPIALVEIYPSLLTPAAHPIRDAGQVQAAAAAFAALDAAGGLAALFAPRPRPRGPSGRRGRGGLDPRGRSSRRAARRRCADPRSCATTASRCRPASTGSPSTTRWRGCATGSRRSLPRKRRRWPRLAAASSRATSPRCGRTRRPPTPPSTATASRRRRSPRSPAHSGCRWRRAALRPVRRTGAWSRRGRRCAS